MILRDILADILQISEGKDIVIIDGIGNPATGSIIGVSNVDIAVSLAAPVLFVGKAGIRSAIDDTILAVSFIQQQGIQNYALIYNKISPSELVGVKHYVNKRLSELLPDVPVLDFIPEQPQLDNPAKQHSANKVCQWFDSHTFN